MVAVMRVRQQWGQAGVESVWIFCLSLCVCDCVCAWLNIQC